MVCYEFCWRVKRPNVAFDLLQSINCARRNRSKYLQRLLVA